jgi:hypothetical protein
MPLELQIREREGTTRAVPLDGGRLTLGRSHDNDLAFASDASLSRHHLVFEEDAEGWTGTRSRLNRASSSSPAPMTARRPTRS